MTAVGVIHLTDVALRRKMVQNLAEILSVPFSQPSISLMGRTTPFETTVTYMLARQTMRVQRQAEELPHLETAT